MLGNVLDALDMPICLLTKQEVRKTAVLTFAVATSKTSTVISRNTHKSACAWQLVIACSGAPAPRATCTNCASRQRLTVATADCRPFALASCCPPCATAAPHAPAVPDEGESPPSFRTLSHLNPSRERIYESYIHNLTNGWGWGRGREWGERERELLRAIFYIPHLGMQRERERLSTKTFYIPNLRIGRESERETVDENILYFKCEIGEKPEREREREAIYENILYS